MTHSKTAIIISAFLMFYSVGSVITESRQYDNNLFISKRSGHNLTLSEGIMNMKWGILIQEAQKVWPDLKKKTGEVYNLVPLQG